MAEREDIQTRLQNILDHPSMTKGSSVIGDQWGAAITDAKTEIERLRKYEDTIRMACRW
jgi:hypothetical protein